jgi:acyl-CoA synthetase (NDP forming)
MGQHNLNRIMKPQQVTVVGAGEKSGTIGNVLMKNLQGVDIEKKNRHISLPAKFRVIGPNCLGVIQLRE